MQQVMACGGAANLLDCFEDASSAHLVQELCKGGDLRRHVEVRAVVRAGVGCGLADSSGSQGLRGCSTCGMRKMAECAGLSRSGLDWSSVIVGRQ